MPEMLAPQFQAGRVRLVKIIILLLWIKDVQSIAFCNNLTDNERAILTFVHSNWIQKHI